MNKNLALVWIFTFVVLVFQLWSAYDTLPERMPSHFNSQGEADGYSTKSQFYSLWFFTLALLNILLPSVNLLLKVVPSSMINIPNREYWFAVPDRKREVIAKMTNLMVALAVCLNVMFFLIFESIRSFALTGTASVPIWAPFALLPIIMVGPIVYLYRTFRVPTAR
ncbi:MAG: DUF1648 domain-containing protein [Candidatus Zixiibacteriota bacterium]